MGFRMFLSAQGFGNVLNSEVRIDSNTTSSHARGISISKLMLQRGMGFHLLIFFDENVLQQN
jgi:hypothetical protein